MTTGSPPPTPPAAASGSDPNDAGGLVDRLVDGTLDSDARTRLARAMERDGALQTDARELEGVNDRLKAFFSVPTPDITAMPLKTTQSASFAFSRRAAIGLLAACLVIGGVVLALTLGGSESPWVRQARELYRSIEASGFKPQQVCTTPEQFAEWTGQNIGEALTPQVGVSGLELVGWNKSSTFSPYTGILIAKVDGKGVIVFLDRAALVTSEGTKELGNGLKAFPGMIGSVGAVEVTPFDSARVIATISPAAKGSN